LYATLWDEQLNSNLTWNLETTRKIFNRIFTSEANVAMLKSNQRLADEIMRSAKHVAQKTNKTAELAGRTAGNLESSLESVKKSDSLQDSIGWLENGLREIKQFNQLGQRLGGDLLVEGAKLDNLLERFEELESMAFTDELTQLNNRRAWDRKLKSEFERFQRLGRACCVFIMDIDDFKVVNDTYGHDVGDNALQAMAKIMRSSLRSYDYPARYGGEEFCGLLPDTELKLARLVAERLRRRLAATRFQVRGQEVMITASLGVSYFQTKDKDGTDAVRRADLAMYLAKSKGKNRVYSDWEVQASSSVIANSEQVCVS
jgi:diguanylate cyclase (GGDEF)-like protein